MSESHPDGSGEELFADGKRAGAGGDQVGPWQRWHATGQLLDSGSYERGVRTGEWTTYAPDGTVKGT